MRMNQRRTNSPSNPTPPPPLHPPLQAHPAETPLQLSDFHTYPPPRSPANDNSFVSTLPPTLPPIARVTYGYEGSNDLYEVEERNNTPSISAPRWFEEEQHTWASPHGLQPANSRSGPSSDHTDHRHNLQGLEWSPGAVHDVPSLRPRSQFRAATAPVPVLAEKSTSAYQLPAPTTNAETLPQWRSPQPNSSTQHPRLGKAKLNLLNPMSLLARRRSSQLMSQRSSDSSGSARSLTIPGMRLPEDYDPRIRGKVIHDFSAPRSQRGVSSHGTANEMAEPAGSGSAQSSSDNVARDTNDRRAGGFVPAPEQPNPEISGGNLKFGEREHMPVFKEHFGDDIKPWSKDQGALSSERIALTLSHSSIPEPNREPPPLPAFARNLPPDLIHPSTPYHPETKVATNLSLSALPDSNSPEYSSRPTSRPTSRSNAVPVTDSSFQPAGLPKHLASNASRFSFDLAGIGSAAQEKLLEDKHKQKEITRKSVASATSANNDSREHNDYDDEDGEEAYLYDDLGNEDDFEERVPGVNTDAEDYNIDATAGPPALFSVIEAGISEELPGSSDSQDSQAFSESQATNAASITNGLGLLTLDKPDDSKATAKILARRGPPPILEPPSPGSDYDDLYFDDGVITHPEGVDLYDFDESVFDNETSGFYGGPLEIQRASPPTGKNSVIDNLKAAPKDNRGGQNDEYTTSAYVAQAVDSPAPFLKGAFETAPRGPDSPVQQQQWDKSGFSKTAGLTQDNLAAYHDALVYATQQATAEGKFGHQQSMNQKRSGEAKAASSQRDYDWRSGLIVDDSHASQDLDIFPPSSETPDDFDYEDDMVDDPIIAAANAEALENDDEDFYGQEFGFYAQANGTGETQYANGGYFGSRGVDGITRSHSGRVNFQEPSLTPITERSEFSNRNSMISMGMYGAPHAIGPPSTAPLPSPGLFQLADMMHLEDDELSLSALMKLRRGAWGGSDASLQSSAGSHASGSPLTHLPPLGSGDILSIAGPMGASNHSLASSNGIGSDEASLPSSPTITLQTQGLAMTMPTQTDRSSGSDSSPIKRSAAKGKGHKRNSSGADSVSYIKERSGDGSATWVIEKRRIAESGQVEIVGRELVMGGRI